MSPQDAAAILAKIQHVLPAVTVFFEFGRPMVSYGEPPMMVFRLMDVLYHARLQDIDHLMACVDMINQALAEARQDGSARLCAFDNEGHCLIPVQTQQSIATLWQKVAANRQPASARAEGSVAAA